MPKGRIVVRSITESKKLAALETDGARLLYTWLVVMVDREGRFTGDPFLVNSRVFVRLGKSEETVEEYLQDLEDKNLIVRWDHEGDTFLCLPNFHEKTPGTNKMKEAKSEIPDPPKELIKEWGKRINSGPTPDQLRTNSGQTLACKNKDKDKDKDKNKNKKSEEEDKAKSLSIGIADKKGKNTTKKPEIVMIKMKEGDKKPENFLIEVDGRKKQNIFLFDPKEDQTPSLERDGFEQIDVKICQYLINRILEWNLRSYVAENLNPKTLRTWLIQSRLMRIDDQRPMEELKRLLKWSQDDDFWKINILSISKFRTKYDQLLMERSKSQPTSFKDKYGPGLKAVKEMMKNEEE